MTWTEAGAFSSIVTPRNNNIATPRNNLLWHQGTTYCDTKEQHFVTPRSNYVSAVWWVEVYHGWRPYWVRAGVTDRCLSKVDLVFHQKFTSAEIFFSRSCAMWWEGWWQPSYWSTTLSLAPDMEFLWYGGYMLQDELWFEHIQGCWAPWYTMCLRGQICESICISSLVLEIHMKMHC